MKCVVFGGGWDVACVLGRLSGVWCVELSMTCAVCSCSFLCLVCCNTPSWCRGRVVCCGRELCAVAEGCVL